MDTIIKNKILKTARSLFRNQGYDQTTIRQLVQACGITTGSLYKYFDNKTAIFEAVRYEEILRVDTFVNQSIKDYDNPLLLFALEIRIIFTMIQNHELYAEAILAYYDHYPSGQKQVDQIIIKSRKCFNQYIDDFSHEDVRDRALIMKGINRSFISDYLYGYNSDLDDKINLIIKTIYGLYDLTDDLIEAVIKNSETIISNNMSILLDLI